MKNQISSSSSASRGANAAATKDALKKKTAKLVSAICAEYSKLGFIGKYDDFYFNRFHDILLIQQDCAMESEENIECLLQQNKIDHAEAIVSQLEETLTYCTNIIKGQQYLRKLLENAPEPVFG